tara:strand:+ start:316 stop:495 length:180 start_codon:yes stop_codon:yes gene_type:complete
MNDLKTVTMNAEKFNDLIRYVEDERAECIEKDVEPSEDLKDAYEAISEIFRQLYPTKKS